MVCANPVSGKEHNSAPAQIILPNSDFIIVGLNTLNNTCLTARLQVTAGPVSWLIGLVQDTARRIVFRGIISAGAGRYDHLYAVSAVGYTRCKLYGTGDR